MGLIMLIALLVWMLINNTTYLDTECQCTDADIALIYGDHDPLSTIYEEDNNDY